ncbi:MAG: type II secretion system F family protein [Candidatus Acidiferrales bacterium]|jgi:type IV pilus assembly protein PilC
MADYLCKVADASGRVFSQVETAQTVVEARQKLADRGLFVYSVKARGGIAAALFHRRRERTVSGTDFLVFNQQFNTLIKAGIPIMKALDLLADRAASPRLRPVLGEVRRRVKEGVPLSEALEQEGVFSPVYTTAVLAGEKSGNLSGVLDYYIAYQRVSTGVRKRLLQTLIYPALLAIVATIIVAYLVAYVIPQFSKLYADLNVQLPGSTQFLIALTVTHRWVLYSVVGAIVAIAVIVALWARSEAGGLSVDRIKLKLPLVGETWIKFQIAQFCRTLSTLQAGGTPLVNAMDTAAGSVSSRLISGSITRAAQLVREGQTLHSAMGSTGLMPELALEMIEVGEASGALSPMLASVAEFYEEEVNLRLQTMIAIVEPAILIFMAILIAFILIALYLPLFSISTGGAPQ